MESVHETENKRGNQLKTLKKVLDVLRSKEHEAYAPTLISQKTGASYRTVCKCLEFLEAEEAIEVIRGRGVTHVRLVGVQP